MLPRCVGRSGARHALTVGGRAATIPAPRWSTPSAGRRSGPVAAGSPLSLDPREGSVGSMSMATKTKRQSRAAFCRPPTRQALPRSSSAPLCSYGGLYGLHLVVLRRRAPELRRVGPGAIAVMCGTPPDPRWAEAAEAPAAGATAATLPPHPSRTALPPLKRKRICADAPFETLAGCLPNSNL